MLLGILYPFAFFDLFVTFFFMSSSVPFPQANFMDLVKYVEPAESITFANSNFVFLNKSSIAINQSVIIT